MAFAGEHRDRQILHWRPVVFTDGSRVTLGQSLENVLTGSVMIWGRTALHELTRGSLTAVMYPDQILKPRVRPHAGAVGPWSPPKARPHWTSCGCIVSAVSARRRFRWNGPARSFPVWQGTIPRLIRSKVIWACGGHAHSCTSF